VDDHAVLATKVNQSIIPAERGKNKKEKRKKAGGEIPWRFRHRDTELCPPNKLMAKHVRSDETFSQLKKMKKMKKIIT